VELVISRRFEVAKLFLKFEQAVLKEVPLSQGVVTIGRLPDNLIHVDNLAVSGHHAKIYWDNDKYVIEDNNSLNGTFLNNRRISKAALKDDDVILIGKHTVTFKDAWHDDSAGAAKQVAGPAVPKMEATMVLDTKKAKEMIAAATAGAASATAGGPHATPPPIAAPGRERTGTLAILDGKTDQKNYVLGKMSVIGKSDMASIKLKGFFAPNMAALINKRDNRYFIAASEAKIKVKINGEVIAGQKELTEGDVVEVAGVKASFGFQE
jgi:pSer/pThr/pTyr-binding forkhead associated (FHA) protein